MYVYAYIISISTSKQRYDLFVLEEFVEIVEDPEAIYHQLVEHVQADLKPVSLDQVAWETNLVKLKWEMQDTANLNSPLSPQDIEEMSTDDWKPLLSDAERKKYDGYLKKLGMDDVPKEKRGIRAVCVGQDPERYCMAGSETKLPSFTCESTKRIMMTHLDRWLTAREKASLTGFPVHKDAK